MIARAGQSMDRNEVAKRDGNARRAFNVSERHTFIHPKYDMVLDGAQIEPTGRLVIARLKPKTSTLPEFVLRWHEKDKHLDVDPVHVSEAEERQFRRGTSDHCGHHTDKLDSGPRVFEANIRWRGQPIYHGKIGFSLAREAEIRVGLSVSASVGFNKENG
jgi:hypothetical protein